MWVLRSVVPAQAGIQARSLWIAGLLDSRLRGNDDSALLVVKNLPLKGIPPP